MIHSSSITECEWFLAYKNSTLVGGAFNMRVDELTSAAYALAGWVCYGVMGVLFWVASSFFCL
jgi:hypothetical protein